MGNEEKVISLSQNTVKPIFLDADELSSLLKVHKSWVYSRTKETGPGSMPRVKVGKYLRFELDAVLNWLRELK